jgi:hypothetical protein
VLGEGNGLYGVVETGGALVDVLSAAGIGEEDQGKDENWGFG